MSAAGVTLLLCMIFKLWHPKLDSNLPILCRLQGVFGDFRGEKMKHRKYGKKLFIMADMFFW